MTKPKRIIFISHMAEEVDLAVMFNKHIEDDFLDLVDVFVSSDSESISLGADWRIRVETAPRQACIQLILCSQASVTQPWINFEAGAVWLRKARVAPICYTSFRKAKPPSTLGQLLPITVGQTDAFAAEYFGEMD
jgi:TIR domain